MSEQRPLNTLLADIVRQFIRFAAVGAIATGIQYLILWLGTTAWGIPPVPASAAGYATGMVFGFICNHFFTFGGKAAAGRAALRYLIAVGFGWCLNLGLMTLFVGHLAWNVWFSQVLTTGLVLCWNFSASRWWAFKHH